MSTSLSHELNSLSDIIKQKEDLEARIKLSKKLICEKYLSIKEGDKVIADGDVATGETVIVKRTTLVILDNGFEFRALGGIMSIFPGSRSHYNGTDPGRGTGKATYPIINGTIIYPQPYKEN
jgi:hypothetical protein